MRNHDNSGLWTSGRSNITVPEDVQMFILPMSRETEFLYYNQRLILDNHVLTEPRAWRISKINRLTSNGVVVVTCGQDKFNPNADYLDPIDGYWWADFYDSKTGAPNATKEQEPIDNVHGIIVCAGSQNIKVHGSYKKLTITYYDGETPIEPRQGTWHFFMDGNDATSLVVTKTDISTPYDIKVKFVGESEYIGKELVIRFTPDIGDSVEFTLPIVSL